MKKCKRKRLLTWSAGGGENDGEADVGLCVSCLRFPFASPVFLFWTFSFAFNSARRPGYWDGRDKDDDEMLVFWVRLSLFFCFVYFSSVFWVSVFLLLGVLRFFSPSSWLLYSPVLLFWVWKNLHSLFLFVELIKLISKFN